MSGRKEIEVLKGDETKELTQKVVEQLYPREELMANTQSIFGVTTEVLAGALHGNDAQELTILESKKAIKEFLEKRVN